MQSPQLRLTGRQTCLKYIQVQGLNAAMECMSPFKQQPHIGLRPGDPATAALCLLAPFEPGLHKALLAGLQPPLEQVGALIQVA